VSRAEALASAFADASKPAKRLAAGRQACRVESLLDIR